MRAVIMCGGRGERLRPLTDTCPKPLLPVAGRPVLDRLLEKLSEAGIQDVTLAVGYLGQMIEEYVGDGARWGVRADYVRQVEPMGTAGALSLLSACDPLLVVNGDKVFERAHDIGRVMTPEHILRPAVGTLPHQLPYGVVREWDGDHFFDEKPIVYACAGIYRLPALILSSVAHGYMDMNDLLKSRVDNVPLAGYVLDIGTPATYEAANARLSSR